MKIWNPRASRCSGCPELKPIKDGKTKTVDPHKKLCQKWSWEIINELAQAQAVCKIPKADQRKRRKKCQK